MWTLTWTAFYYCTLKQHMPNETTPPPLLRGDQQYTICVLKLYIKQLNTLSFTEYV